MNTNTPATSRTWATVTYFQDCGVVREVARHSVTLTMTAAGIVATVDGQEVPTPEAVGLLRRADSLTVTAETLAPAPIGKAAACRLHKIMGRLGLPSAQHYSLAAAALGEWAPVPSLAALSPVEARAVWRHLCALYPQAHTLAGQVAA
ncbi:hypothetical protein QOL99_03005 [Deinococcus sp. MIMF12]|uniref:Uncharacterized protein n=1 Tax=Deinococcus rhizophilus TaxID=3049544 RepID=A0ABT7JHG0_9DEIO|nr:hypothetical protein [Deinococcus rhizophilus]MDL2343114.1 hypothetical protein [Deinococcus rhizophilus]